MKILCRLLGHKLEEGEPYTAPGVLICERGDAYVWGGIVIEEPFEEPSK